MFQRTKSYYVSISKGKIDNHPVPKRCLFQDIPAGRNLGVSCCRLVAEPQLHQVF